MITKKLLPIYKHYQKYYFTISKLFKHWTLWSCILYAMVHRSVLQWKRGVGTVVAVHFSNEERAYLYITPCVKCGFTHASRAEIRIFTPSDIKFRKILVRKTFSWRVTFRKRFIALVSYCTIVAVLHFHFMTLHSTDAKVNFPGKSTRFLTFSTNHRRESKVLLLSLLLLHRVLHFSIFSTPNRQRKPPFSMSVSGEIFISIKFCVQLSTYESGSRYHCNFVDSTNSFFSVRTRMQTSIQTFSQNIITRRFRLFQVFRHKQRKQNFIYLKAINKNENIEKKFCWYTIGTHEFENKLWKIVHKTGSINISSSEKKVRTRPGKY